MRIVAIGPQRVADDTRSFDHHHFLSPVRKSICCRGEAGGVRISRMASTICRAGCRDRPADLRLRSHFATSRCHSPLSPIFKVTICDHKKSLFSFVNSNPSPCRYKIGFVFMILPQSPGSQMLMQRVPGPVVSAAALRYGSSRADCAIRLLPSPGGRRFDQYADTPVYCQARR